MDERNIQPRPGGRCKVNDKPYFNRDEFNDLRARADNDELDEDDDDIETELALEYDDYDSYSGDHGSI